MPVRLFKLDKIGNSLGNEQKLDDGFGESKGLHQKIEFHSARTRCNLSAETAARGCAERSRNREFVSGAVPAELSSANRSTVPVSTWTT